MARGGFTNFIWKILKAIGFVYLTFCTYILLQFTNHYDTHHSPQSNMNAQDYNHSRVIQNLLEERSRLLKERDHMIKARSSQYSKELASFNQLLKDREKQKSEKAKKKSNNDFKRGKEGTDRKRTAMDTQVKSGSLKVQKEQTAFDSFFDSWKFKKIHLCNDRIFIHDEKMALFQNISIFTKFAHAKAKGGETLTDVIDQKEEDEVYTLEKGFFQVHCDKLKQRDIYMYGGDPHLKIWRSVFQSSSNKLQTSTYEDTFTIVIVRYEYANVYWAMMDIYNAFIISHFFEKSPKDVEILIMDAHPATPLDSLWPELFKKVTRLSELPHSVTYRNLVWPYSRSFSPMLANVRQLPLVQEYRTHVLSSLGLPHDRKPRCDGQLNLLFVWRRDYVAHPRNPNGQVKRKISNEEEIIAAVKESFPQFNIKGVQLDEYPPREQLSIMQSADIFIGMHGAAHALSLFLPPGGAVIELFPLPKKMKSDGKGFNWHMEYIARWSGHHFLQWININPDLEDSEHQSTKLPEEVVVGLVKEAANKVCSGLDPPIPPPPHMIMGGSYTKLAKMQEEKEAKGL